MIITFIPDRLNRPPVIWRGFTVAELGLSALLGALSGLGLSFLIVLLTGLGFVIIPVMTVLMPLPVVWFTGSVLARIKRNKPDSFVAQRTGLAMARLLAFDGTVARHQTYYFIQGTQHWEIRRSRKKNSQRGKQ